MQKRLQLSIRASDELYWRDGYTYEQPGGDIAEPEVRRGRLAEASSLLWLSLLEAKAVYHLVEFDGCRRT